jgi:2-oxoisovalerate ferredoxin oxidoreductase alpha subunit
VNSTRLVKGNSAVVVGALYGGCHAFFGYPITPASEILHDASRYFPKAGRTFLQAASETAAINMVYGAAGAGRRSMTASSGPGISLMQEGFSYLAGAELPAVIVDIVRAGPGLGNIGPEQSDYNQIVKGGGHGNYHNIVLAPASVQEMCDMTMDAFERADRWRNPVVVLADAVLGQMMEPLTLPDKAVEPVLPTGWPAAATPETRGNVVTSIFLDFDELEQVNYTLHDKYARMQETDAEAECLWVDDADTVLIAYGVSARIAKSAALEARRQGKKVGVFRPKTLFPFPLREFNEIAKRGSRLIVMELSNGQLRDDLKLMTDFSVPLELVSRCGGNLISVESVLELL